MTTKHPDPEKSNNKVTIGDVGGGIYNSIIAGGNVIKNITIINSPDISTILTSEHQADLDHARDLLNSYKPGEALEYLEKLKNRIWSNTQPIVKYRILANIGAAKLLQNQYQEATSQFIEALQYNPDDEKALCNVALGYLLLEQHAEAEIYAKKALAKNPANSHAYALLIQTSSDTEALENIIAKVPELSRTTSEVAFAMGILARKRRHLLEAKQWLEIALVHDEKDHPELRGELGGILLELAITPESVLNGLQLTDNQKAQIQKAIELLDAALSRAGRAERWDSRLGWLVNRGTAKQFLGDLAGAIQDIEKALEADPSNPEFIGRRARLAYETGDKEKAITLLKGIISSQESLDAPLLLAHILRSTRRSPEAIDIVNSFLKKHPDDQFQEKANRELIELYLDIGDFENAKKISDAMRAANPTGVLNFVDAAEIAFVSGKPDEALSLLQEAKQYLTPSSPTQQQVELANAFYALKEFEDAARIYEYFVDPSLDTQLTYQLLMSYYHAGDIGKALTVCQTLRQRYGILKNISDMEATIYEEIGDLPNAKSTAQEYLASFPEHFGMKLLVAVVNSRTGKIEELDQFLRLAAYADVETLPWEFGIRLVQLYTERNQLRRAIEILYELRRKFSDQGIIHQKYIQAFLFLKESEDNNTWLLPSIVDVNVAVCVQEMSGKCEWYIIDDRKDAELSRREITPQHPIAKKLREKTVGDEITLTESPYSKKVGKIADIKSKYIYALHESRDSYETLFPEVPGFWTIDGTDEEKTEKILDVVTNHHKTYLDIEQWYNQGRLPLGAFACLIGRNVIGVWANFTTKAEVGIKCCYGTHEERDAALSLLKDMPTLIIDMIALLTLYHLQAADVVVNAYGKLGVAQATVDLLHHAIGIRQGMESEGFSTLGKEGDYFVMEDISPEKAQQVIEYLKRLCDWVKTNCVILPCHAALIVKRAQRKQLKEAIGKAFVDTILIASEPGNILYSDDERLRALAKKEHHIEGVWTQILLMNCLNNNLLEKERYHEMVIKLVTSHYYHTSINSEILIEAAKQAGWSPSEPYTTVLQILRGGFSEEDSVVNVGAQFLLELWKQDIWKQQPEHRDALIQSLFKAITTGRDPTRTLDKLKTHVRSQFKFLPFEEREILSLIDVWRQTHIT